MYLISFAYLYYRYMSLNLEASHRKLTCHYSFFLMINASKCFKMIQIKLFFQS